MATRKLARPRRAAPDAPDRTSVVRAYSTISHTLPNDLVLRLRAFAHYQRVSASAVIEYALRGVFKAKADSELGAMLRRKGAGPRRKARPS